MFRVDARHWRSRRELEHEEGTEGCCGNFPEPPLPAELFATGNGQLFGIAQVGPCISSLFCAKIVQTGLMILRTRRCTRLQKKCGKRNEQSERVCVCVCVCVSTPVPKELCHSYSLGVTFDVSTRV